MFGKTFGQELVETVASKCILYRGVEDLNVRLIIHTEKTGPKTCKKTRP